MIEDWLKIVKESVKKLQEEYKEDYHLITNESELKKNLSDKIQNHQEVSEKDILVKHEAPWYEDSSLGIPKLLFYIDLVLFKNSKFEIDENIRLGKKYRYEDLSLPIMLKFAKPNFQLRGISEDIKKLQKVAEGPNIQNLVLIVATMNGKLFNTVKKRVEQVLEELPKNPQTPFTVIVFNQENIEIY